MRILEIRKNDAGQRLDKFLQKAVKTLPIPLMYRLIRQKKIKVNRKRAEQNYILQEGDTVQLFISEDFFTEEGQKNDFMRLKPRLHIVYEGDCDKDTVFNLTNHSYFNLAGHDKGSAMDQLLTIPGQHFTPADAQSIPTGELRHVEGTPMDFRTPKAIGRDIEEDYECLKLQGGYDHNWEVWSNPCAILQDPTSGRTMCVFTDLPGLQFYAGNFIDETGKGGTYYGKRSGIALETQFYPDALNNPDWDQPIFKAGEHFHSETVYYFE